MAEDNYYLLTSLPALGELGSAPPVSPAELVGRVQPFPLAKQILEVLFLGHDLLLREAFLAGEIDRLDDLAVLSVQQARNEAPLPEFLVPEARQRRIPADDLWEAYFRYAARAGRQTGCFFLRAWVGYEVAVRNSIAVARAKALDLDPTDYLVAPELADREVDTRSIVAEWSSAPTPLAAYQVLERARWEWVKAHDRWFSFAHDELAAYGAKLLILARWLRLAKAQSGKEPRPQTVGTS